VEERLGERDEFFDNAGESAIATDLGEESFDNPSTFVDLKADLVGYTAQDLDGNASGLGNLRRVARGCDAPRHSPEAAPCRQASK
jgi:hypothetical protein